VSGNCSPETGSPVYYERVLGSKLFSWRNRKRVCPRKLRLYFHRRKKQKSKDKAKDRTRMICKEGWRNKVNMSESLSASLEDQAIAINTFS
jgi:hypothetical protein